MLLGYAAVAFGIVLIVSVVAFYLRDAIADCDDEHRARMAALMGNARWERFGAVAFGLNLLLCSNQVFEQVHRGAAANEILFSFVAAIALAFAFGLCAARVLSRQSEGLNKPN